MRNPEAKPFAVLGKTAIDWQSIKDAVKAYCVVHADKQDLPDADVRAVHAALADDKVWNQIRAEMGL